MDVNTSRVREQVLEYGASFGAGVYAVREAFADAPPRILAVEPCAPLFALGRSLTQG
ncbi:hypothetical protein T484DRAFT_1805982 [Baffinella frigidus]|nr:hypothetical protein T484DRAFT_1805982 [Cryptophyta sp. CCMP2293]